MSEKSQNSADMDNSAPNENSTEGNAENDGDKSENTEGSNDGKSENTDQDPKNTETKAENAEPESQTNEKKSGNEDGKLQGNDGNYEKKNSSLENNEEEPKKKHSYPMPIFFILGNEFCERFSYYGLRTILTLYLSLELGYDEKVATMIYHSFVLLNYFTPLIGAIISDSWLGKYHTILYISIIYAMGNIILSIGSIPMEKTKMVGLSMFGLVIIGCGTGGIKPCVSAFGGDQFEADQVKERQHFFSIFYFIINFGSLISTILSPILREDVHCLGKDTCYVLAFSVPALLMAVSLTVFVLGKPLYKMVPVRGSVFPEVFKCIGHAVSNKTKSKGEKKDHWLDYAEDKYDKKQIQDIKTLLNVMLLFLPLPFFWCLFEQMSSTWVLQATKMNGDVHGFVIQPDQMQAWNPLFILIFIPVFDFIVYPLLGKCNLLQTPLKRMAAGMLCVAVSFVAVGVVELSLEDAEPVKPAKGYSEVRIINNSPCTINMTGSESKTMNAFGKEVVNVELGHTSDWMFEPSNCDVKTGINKTINASTTFETVMVTISNKGLEAMQTNDTKEKLKSGEPKIRIVFSTDFEFTNGGKTAFELSGPKKLEIVPDHLMNNSKAGMTEYYSTEPGNYKVYVPYNTSSVQDSPIGEYGFKIGGTYIIVIYQDQSKNSTQFSVEETVKHNSVSILYQVPANIIATAGEILFSITGLEFAYSQSPTHLKSVVQAAWQLTDAFGNLIYVVIKEMSMAEKQSMEFFIYAIIMAVDTLIFAILCYFYKYAEDKEDPNS